MQKQNLFRFPKVRVRAGTGSLYDLYSCISVGIIVLFVPLLPRFGRKMENQNIVSLPKIRIKVKVVIVNDNDLILTWLNAGKYCYLCTEMC